VQPGHQAVRDIAQSGTPIVPPARPEPRLAPAARTGTRPQGGQRPRRRRGHRPRTPLREAS
jgi:hypothetical protein